MKSMIATFKKKTWYGKYLISANYNDSNYNYLKGKFLKMTQNFWINPDSKSTY